MFAGCLEHLSCRIEVDVIAAAQMLFSAWYRWQRRIILSVVCTVCGSIKQEIIDYNAAIPSKLRLLRRAEFMPICRTFASGIIDDTNLLIAGCSGVRRVRAFETTTARNQKQRHRREIYRVLSARINAP